MRIIAGSAILFFLLVHLRCSVDPLDDIVVVADVKDEFYLDLWEVLGEDERTLHFHISTIDEENCKNAYIDHRFSKSSDGFSISLRDIKWPSICDPGLSPARTNIEMGNLSLGYYNFTVDLKNTVFNEGQLTMLNDRYLIKMETENGVQLTRRELLRVPDATLWGYAHYRSSDDEASALAFINDIKNLGKVAVLKQGYYGHFSIGTGSVVEEIYNQPKEGMVERFLVEYRGPEANLQSLINQYRAAYGAQVDFQLFNSKGQVY